jgi:hypothetical protein
MAASRVGELRDPPIRTTRSPTTTSAGPSIFPIDHGAKVVCAHGFGVSEAASAPVLGLETSFVDPIVVAAAAGHIVLAEPTPGPAGATMLRRLSPSFAAPDVFEVTGPHRFEASIGPSTLSRSEKSSLLRGSNITSDSHPSGFVPGAAPTPRVPTDPISWATARHTSAPVVKEPIALPRSLIVTALMLPIRVKGRLFGFIELGKSSCFSVHQMCKLDDLVAAFVRHIESSSEVDS